MSRFLLVLSSPSGGGKTTIARKLLEARSDVAFSVSATTRASRPGETDGVDYYFLSEAEFERRVGDGEFLEHATYGHHRYGTLLAEVQRIHDGGSHAMLDIEIEGARQVRQRSPDAVTVFLLPPTAEVLAARLRSRETESGEEVSARLGRAREELDATGEYDYVVINEDLTSAVEQVSAIVESESLRQSRRPDVPGLVAELQRGLSEAQAELPAP